MHIRGKVFETGLKIILLLVFGWIAVQVFAGQRTADEALAIAQNRFVRLSKGMERVSPVFSRPVLVYTERSAFDNFRPLFYVFNRQQEQGFVIVSADDKTVDILGYADSGSFDPNQMPPALRSWLKQYKYDIERPSRVRVSQDNGDEMHDRIEKVNAVSAENPAKVIPLLQAIKWNQSAPYNDLCPVINTETKEKAAAGCVATGMAQLMKYHQWPKSGSGKSDYTTKTLQLPVEARFSFVRYDWKNMTNSYGKGSTAEQNAAVATLMYHCGAAVEMDYNKASAASTVKMGKALMLNFRYDADIRLLHRDYYSREEWLQLIKNELNVARPVIYSGSDAEDSGHLFICDGYDENDYLHFNWGWGGLSDGYFYVSDLQPPAGDVGAGSGGGYFYNQQITTGIQKPDGKPDRQYSIYMQEEISANIAALKRSGTFRLNLEKVYNLGLHQFAGKLGLALFQNNRLVKVIKALNVSDLDSYYGYSKLEFPEISLQADIAEGKYLLYPVYKARNETGWTIIRGKNGVNNHFQTEIRHDSIFLSAASLNKPDIRILSFDVVGNVYYQQTARFKIRLENAGYADYHSDIAVYLFPDASSDNKEQITIERVTLKPGEIKEISCSGIVNREPGQYHFRVYYDENNDVSKVKMTPAAFDIPVNVRQLTGGTPDLNVVGNLSFESGAQVYQHDVRLRAKIINKGRFFEDEVIAFVFPATGGSSLAYFGYQTLKIDSLETLEVDFSGDVYLNPANYMVAVYQKDKESWKRLTPSSSNVISLNLKQTDAADTILPEDFCLIYPNPATRKISISASVNIQRIRIFTINGQQVLDVENTSAGIPEIDITPLMAGMYVVKVSDSAGKILTSKMIKK